MPPASGVAAAQDGGKGWLDADVVYVTKAEANKLGSDTPLPDRLGSEKSIDLEAGGDPASHASQ
jgi:hypothetical protein